MDYNVTDADVPKYLEELKKVIFTLGPSSNTGTQNLDVIASFLLANISDTLSRSKEHLAFISKRYSRVSIILKQLEDTTKNTNNLDLRYGFHKSVQNSISTFSGFMRVINMHTDTDLLQYSRTMSEYRRELTMLTTLIAQLDKQISYLTEVKGQLPTLISLCKST